MNSDKDLNVILADSELSVQARKDNRKVALYCQKVASELYYWKSVYHPKGEDDPVWKYIDAAQRNLKEVVYAEVPEAADPRGDM